MQRSILKQQIQLHFEIDMWQLLLPFMLRTVGSNASKRNHLMIHAPNVPSPTTIKNYKWKIK